MQFVMRKLTSRFTKFSAALLLYTILVILWGAFVRISHSGDGCGEHWPLCQGGLLPKGTSLLQTWIEFFHRVKSGVLGLLIATQTVWCFQVFPKSHDARKASVAVLVLTTTEALLGAMLVLGGYVGGDASLGRLMVMSAHFLNTLLLLVALTAVWHLSHFSYPVRQKLSREVRLWLIIISVAIFTLALTGVWAALATTLFPSETLRSGIYSDFSTQSHLFVKLRILHPLTAVFIGSLIWLGISKIRNYAPCASLLFLRIFIAVVGIGALTLLTLSPTLLKLSHLFLVDIMWIAFINLALQVVYQDQASARLM